MSSRDALARALALAFLAGPWTCTHLVERGEQVLGERHVRRWRSRSSLPTTLSDSGTIRSRSRTSGGRRALGCPRLELWRFGFASPHRLRDAAHIAGPWLLLSDAQRSVLLMSLNMLIEVGDGFDYTGADFAGWTKAAGFKKTTVVPLVGPTTAAIAYK